MEADPTLFNFSISGVPVSERREVLREHFGRGVLNLDFEPRTDDPSYEFRIRVLPGVAFTEGSNTPHRASSYDPSRESDDFLFAWSNPGGCIVQRGSEVRSDDGAALLSCAESVTAETRGLMRHRTLRLNRAMLLSVLPRAEEALLEPKSRCSEAFKVLDSYLSLLGVGVALQSPDLAFATAIHICDLVALAVGASRDGEEIARLRGLRAARMKTIKYWLLSRLHDPALSVRDAAIAQKVSPRYVQMLFEAEGTTFSAFVMAERLALAHRRFASPAHSAKAVSAIAYECGFGDLSYFNRAFRAAFGETPSDVRQMALSARPI